MYDKTSTGEMTDIPTWVQYCASKGTSDHYKITIILKNCDEKNVRQQC